MRLVLAQLNFTVGAFDLNFAKIDAAVVQAMAADANLIVFSEMAATGYPPRDLLNHPRFIDMNLAQLDRVAALSTRQLGILIGFVDRNGAWPGARVQRAMPSRYSSESSLTDAAELARNLGIQHRIIAIDGIFQSYLDGLAPAFAGRPQEVTEENPQARRNG